MAQLRRIELILDHQDQDGTSFFLYMGLIRARDLR